MLNLHLYTFSVFWIIHLILQLQYGGSVAEPDAISSDFCSTSGHGLFPHPTECPKFVMCTYGRAIVQACAPGMLFDAQISACNHAHSTTCRQQRPAHHTPQTRAQPYLYDPPGNAPHTARYSYGRDRVDVVHEPGPPPQHQSAPRTRLRELYRQGGNSDYHYSDYQDRGGNRDSTRQPGSTQHKDHGYQTRQGPGDGHQTRQSHGNRNRDRDNTGRYGDYHDQAYARYEYGSGVPQHDRKTQPDRSSYEPSQQYYADAPSYQDKDYQDSKATHNDNTEAQMYHYVHSDTVHPNVFKRVRGPADEFKALHAVDKHVADCHGRSDGLYAATECMGYIQCANGTPHKKRCSEGTYFSPSARTCGYDRTHCQGPSTGDNGGSRHAAADRQTEIGEFMRSSLIEAKVAALSTLQQQAEAAKNMSARARPFASVASFLGSTPYVRQLAMPSFLQLECLKLIKQHFGLSKDEITEVMAELGSALPVNPFKVSPDMEYPIPTLSACPFPRNDADNNCDAHAPFRTIDGSCNNLRRPLWGRSFRALARFIEPDYCDGIGSLRCAQSGRPLPSARAVSAAMFGPDETQSSRVHTVMHMTFGQFLAHDNERTAITKLSTTDDGTGALVDVQCGDDGCSTQGPENSACRPIPVPRRDPDFTNTSCIMFVRTQEVLRDDCSMAPRDQLNQLTPWLDASLCYGSTKNESNQLRDLTNRDRGRLRTIKHPFNSHLKDLLPQKDNKDCRDLNSTIQCFTAGDGRVNEQVGLTSIHTIFHRGHNTFEEELHHLNPHWSGERLFQETRKIIGGIWQFIVYNEYIPLVLGPAQISRFGLNLERNGFWDSYDEETSPDISNAFATAAFRFGHSQISDVIRLVGQLFNRQRELDLSTVFRRPLTVYETNQPAASGIDSILLGMVSQAAEKVDTHFTKEVSVRLFSEDPPRKPGLDLPAINIQRGRDHGVPAYNRWRAWCGLPVARHFDDMVDVPYASRQQLRQLYDSVDDVDLFAAGVVEHHVPGGMVGPTFACMIGTQFRNLRNGDRFWHERPDKTIGFTAAQLQEIRKATFARVICDNTDNVRTIQKFVMLQPIEEAFRRLGSRNYREAYSLASLYRGESNERRPCSHLPQIDLSHWREPPHY